jgi:hypothetical protein
MIGYDLDGVICVEKSWWKIAYKLCYKIAVWFRDKHKPQFIPGGSFVIITNRPEEDREATVKWLYKYNIYPRSLLMSGLASPLSASFKIDCIKSLGITKFVESDQEIARKIIASCPKVGVHVWPQM